MAGMAVILTIAALAEAAASENLLRAPPWRKGHGDDFGAGTDLQRERRDGDPAREQQQLSRSARPAIARCGDVVPLHTGTYRTKLIARKCEVNVVERNQRAASACVKRLRLDDRRAAAARISPWRRADRVAYAAGTGSAVTDLIFSIAKREVTFFSGTALISFL